MLANFPNLDCPSHYRHLRRFAVPTDSPLSGSGRFLCGSFIPSENVDKDGICGNHSLLLSTYIFHFLLRLTVFVNIKDLHLDLLSFQVVVMFMLSSVGFFVLSCCLYRHQIILPSYNSFKMSAVCFDWGRIFPVSNTFPAILLHFPSCSCYVPYRTFSHVSHFPCAWHRASAWLSKTQRLILFRNIW